LPRLLLKHGVDINRDGLGWGALRSRVVSGRVTSGPPLRKAQAVPLTTRRR